MLMVHESKCLSKMRFLLTVLLLLIQLLITGLFQSAGAWELRKEKMTPHGIQITTTHSEKIFAKLITPVLVMSSLDQPSYAYIDTLQQSLAESKLFAISKTEETADYLLDITILRWGVGNLDQGNPYLTTYLISKWSLKNNKTGDIVCKKDIIGVNTNDMNFNFLDRSVRYSYELSAAANIKQGIEWLSRQTSKITSGITK